MDTITGWSDITNPIHITMGINHTRIIRKHIDDNTEDITGQKRREETEWMGEAAEGEQPPPPQTADSAHDGMDRKCRESSF